MRMILSFLALAQLRLSGLDVARSDLLARRSDEAMARAEQPRDPLAATIAGGLQTTDTNSLRAARDKALADRNARLTGAHRQTAA